ncbi:hypothetical protein AALB19_04005 [Oscillospiraceae bacterium 50-58]
MADNKQAIIVPIKQSRSIYGRSTFFKRDICVWRVSAGCQLMFSFALNTAQLRNLCKVYTKT